MIHHILFSTCFLHSIHEPSYTFQSLSDELLYVNVHIFQGIVKPDIVFFGEDLPMRFYRYMKDMLQTDLVLVMGTSLEVAKHVSFFYTLIEIQAAYQSAF